MAIRRRSIRSRWRQTPMAPGLIHLAGLLAIVALIATACSSDATPSTVSAVAPPSHSSGTLGTGAGGSGAGVGTGTGTTSGGGIGGSGTTSTSTDGSSAGADTKKKHHAAGATGAPTTRPSSQPSATTTTGIPPLRQQFVADDGVFQAALRRAQIAAGRLPTGASPDQAALAMQPLMAAADQYQSQVVNLQWSATVKPLTQSLTESLGQLTAVLTGILLPSGFPSTSKFRSELSSAAAGVRSASSAVRSQLGQA